MNKLNLLLVMLISAIGIIWVGLDYSPVHLTYVSAIMAMIICRVAIIQVSSRVMRMVKVET